MRGYNPTTLNKTKQLGTILGLAAIGATAFSAGSAFAQGTILEEIVVTAQRREENIRDVPISVSTLTGERVQEYFEGGADIRALAARFPSLYAESSNGRVAPRFYLRGLGNADFDLAASQSVLVVVDEVVQENVVLKSFPLFDLERVEVLRGPQGTLFGRNTPAGIIKFDTRKPTADFNGYGILTGGSVGTINVEGGLGGSLNKSETLMGRVSILSQNRDDWIRNGFTGEEDAMGGFNELAWRAQLLWQPSDNFSALANLHGRQLKNATATMFRANIVTTGNNELNNNFTRDTVYFDTGDNNPQETEAIGGTLKLEWSFANEMTLTSITAYETVDNYRSLGDIDGGVVDFSQSAPIPPGITFDPNVLIFGFLPATTFPGTITVPSTTAGDLDDLTQLTQEFRLSSQANDRLFWQAGLFYFDSDFRVTTSPFFVPPTIHRNENTAWAVFGHISYDFTDRLTLVGGLRYTNDDKTTTIEQANFPISPNPIKVDDAEPSWDISANYVLNDQVNLYARVARGFRGPSIQARNVAFFGDPSVADSETILSGEVGMKSSFFDDRIRLNGAIYYYEISDQQFTAIGGASNSVQLLNADKGVGSGFDLDTEFLITDNLYLSVGFSYNKTEIQDSDLRVAVCGSGLCSVTDPVDVDGFALIDGNPFPQAPETLLNVTLRYTYPVDTGNLFFVTDWFRQGDTNFFLYESNESHSGEIYEGGARVGYKHGNGKWEIAVFGRNITDRKNLKGAIDFSNNTGFVNDRPIWGATLKVNFGE